MSTLAANGERQSPPGPRVGGWRVDPAGNEVSQGSESVKLEPKAVEVLMHLARRAGEVVPREELLSTVWPGVIVGDDALTQAIIKLRKAFGDDAHHPKFIETISKRGYRLIAPVDWAPGGESLPIGNRALGKRGPWLAGAGISLALVVGLWYWLKVAQLRWPIAPDTPRPVAASLPVVAVLPLSNLSGDSKRDYFSDGVTEDIIDALGRFSGVRVMSRNAVQPYKGKSAAPQAIRTELGARYIVQGSVREAGGKVRVAVELSDAELGTQLWSERFDGDSAQVFEIQDRIAKNIVGALAVKLTRVEEQRVFTQPTENLEAYDLLLRARMLMARHERAANRDARELLGRARKLAPEYAEVLIAQCGAEFQRAMYGWVEDVIDVARRAEDLCNGALSNPDVRTHSRAHAALASIYSNQNRFEEATRHAERAIELNPSDATALYRLGAARLYAGKIDEAIAAMETAGRFEPHSFESLNLAIAYYVVGRYADALAQVEAVKTRNPANSAVLAVSAATLAQMGKLDEARREAAEVRRFSPEFRAEYYGTRFANPDYAARLQEGARKAGL